MPRPSLTARRSTLLLTLAAAVASAAMTACADPTAPKNELTTRKSGYVVTCGDKDTTNTGGAGGQ